MRTTCYKCGKEIEGTRTMAIWPTCPECEQLEILKGIHNDHNCGSSNSSNDGGYLITDKDIAMANWAASRESFFPAWASKALENDAPICAALLCFFFGFAGGHLFYLRKYTTLAWLMLITAVLSLWATALLLFPICMVLSIMYFNMDPNEFRRRYFPERFKNHFMAELCTYNLVQFRIPMPTVAPKSFADCVLTLEEKESYKERITGYVPDLYFKANKDMYEGVETSLGISWQEHYLIETAHKFPELASECKKALEKIYG